MTSQESVEIYQKILVEVDPKFGEVVAKWIESAPELAKSPDVCGKLSKNGGKKQDQSNAPELRRKQKNSACRRANFSLYVRSATLRSDLLAQVWA